MNKINIFLEKYKIQILVIISIIIIILLGINIYKSHSNKLDSVKVNPISIQEQVKNQGKDISKNESKEISDTINNHTIHTFYTSTDEQADSQINQIKKDNKADLIVKQEQTKQEVGNNTIYTNNYNLINMEKKHGIGLGTTYINKKPYVNVDYRNRQTTYSIHYSPNTQDVGVSINYEICRW